MATNSKLDALLQSVIENPADLQLRMVYADALQEVGDPHGEFISSQIHGDQATANRLLAAHLNQWTSFLKKHVEEYEFVNGMIERITFDLKHLKHLPKILQESPIHELRFRGMERSKMFDDFHECTERISWLDVTSGELSGTGFGAKFSSGSWSELCRLTAGNNRLGLVGLIPILRTGTPKLTRLDLANTLQKSADFESVNFVDWEQTALLTEINLRGNAVSDFVVAKICARATGLRRLGTPMLGRRTATVLLPRADELDCVEASHIDYDDKLVFDLMVALDSKFRLVVENDPSDFDVEWIP